MKKQKVENTFFDFLAIIISFILNIFRSIKNIVTFKKIKKNRFFDVLDFLFRKWPQYFWKNPTAYKITNFLGDLLYQIFPTKKNKINNKNK